MIECRTVTFEEGLKYLREHEGTRMYSDGLDANEYIVYNKDHYEYEDGCYIGKDIVEIDERLKGIENSWIPSHKFYIED